MYPQKLSFDGDDFRTSRLSEAVELIYRRGRAAKIKRTNQYYY